MQVLIEENLLTPALDALKKTLGDATMPASTCIHIDANAQTGRLLMHSTDGAYHTLARVPAKSITAAGEALVDGKTLTGLVKTFSKKEIKIAQDANHTVLVGSGKKKARVPGIAPDEAIDEPLLQNETKVTLTKQELQHMFQSVDFAKLTRAAGQQDFKFLGIGVKIVKDELFFITTDKHRVALSKMPKQAADMDLVIPAKAFADVLSWAGNDITISLTDNRIKMESGDFVYYGPLLTGNFPPYQKHVAKPTEWAQIDRNELVEALQRADIITQKDDDTPGMVYMTLDPSGELSITGHASTGGLVEEIISCHNPFKEVRKVAVIGRYVLDAIKRIKTDKVDLFMDKTPNRPILVFPESSQDVGHMILVMLLDEDA